MNTIARSSLPYAVLIVAMCLLLYAVPDLALWLPSTLKH
jgi:TRAP-type C4-dicarboxylate transport system permease large subunit